MLFLTSVDDDHYRKFEHFINYVDRATLEDGLKLLEMKSNTDGRKYELISKYLNTVS